MDTREDDEPVELEHNLLLSALPKHPPPPTMRAILSIITPPLSSYPTLQLLPSKTHHLHIPLSDTNTALLLPALPNALAFLHAHRDHRRLVHCLYGVSRSVAVCLAFLAARRFAQHGVEHGRDGGENHGGSTWDAWEEASDVVADTLREIKKRRPGAGPSATFIDQIVSYVAGRPCAVNGFAFTPPRLHRTRCIHPKAANTLLRLSCSPDATEDANAFNSIALPHEPTTADMHMALPWARCARCATPLLPGHAVVDADNGVDGGDVAPFPRGVASLPVLPLQWMAASIVKAVKMGVILSGRLYCPRCNARIGTCALSWCDDVSLQVPKCFHVTMSALDVRENEQVFRTAGLIRHPGRSS